MDIQKQINLILYDIWVKLYGKGFADKAVTHECKLQPPYKKAWEWALKFNKQERVKKFSEMVINSKLR